MNMTPLDPETCMALLTYVGGASALAVAAVLGIQPARFAPALVDRFIALVRRRNI